MGGLPSAADHRARGERVEALDELAAFGKQPPDVMRTRVPDPCEFMFEMTTGPQVLLNDRSRRRAGSQQHDERPRGDDPGGEATDGHGRALTTFAKSLHGATVYRRAGGSP